MNEAVEQMIDKKIIKGLECCSMVLSDCGHCPYGIWGLRICKAYLTKDALKLIQKQQAEIERCHKEFEELNVIEEEERKEALENAKRNSALFNSSMGYARVMAVKEFAQLFAEEFFVGGVTYSITKEEFESFVKEKVGEKHDNT